VRPDGRLLGSFGLRGSGASALGCGLPALARGLGLALGAHALALLFLGAAALGLALLAHAGGLEARLLAGERTRDRSSGPSACLLEQRLLGLGLGLPAGR
jgi:hypothetical protein